MTWFSRIAGCSVLTSIEFVCCFQLREYIDDTKDCLYIQVLHLGTFKTFEVLPEINEDNYFVTQI
jgi:hypothetical protein